MKKLLQVLSSEHGDKPYVFDTEDATIDTTLAEAEVVAVAEARALFDRLSHQGGAAFEITPEPGRTELKTKKRVHAFEELGEQNILVPRFEGG